MCVCVFFWGGRVVGAEGGQRARSTTTRPCSCYSHTRARKHTRVSMLTESQKTHTRPPSFYMMHVRTDHSPLEIPCPLPCSASEHSEWASRVLCCALQPYEEAIELDRLKGKLDMALTDYNLEPGYVFPLTYPISCPTKSRGVAVVYGGFLPGASCLFCLFVFPLLCPFPPTAFVAVIALL